MTDILKRKMICDDVCFNEIEDGRFKTKRISVNFVMPLEKEMVTANALLSLVMSKSCNKYSNLTKMAEKLASLYGASLDTDVRKIGENQVINFWLSTIDDRFSEKDENITEQAAELMQEIIFNPKLDGESFCDDDIKTERQFLIDTIISEINNKRSYAILQMGKIMFENEKYGISKIGYKEDAIKLTGGDLYSAYQNMLKNSRVEILVMGYGNSEKLFDMFKENFSKIKRTPYISNKTTVIDNAETVKTKTEEMNIAQSKLVMGFRTGTSIKAGNINAMRVFMSLFGGSPHSKLFMNVREKMSLCYYCSANSDRIKGVMIVDSGIENENYEKTKTEILNQLNDVKNGVFTDEELEFSKLSVINSFSSVTDTLGSMEGWYLGQIVCDEDISDPLEVAAKVQKITREDVIEAASKISLDTVYFLSGHNKEVE